MSRTHFRTILVLAVSLFLLLGAWVSSSAHAEVARITKNTRVMQERGEKSRVIMRVPPGKTVKVLAKQGSWVKIRYKGRTGWVMRSSITSTTSARKTTTRRKAPFVEGRGKDRDFSGGGPEDRVGADAVEEDDDDDELDDDEVDEIELVEDELDEDELDSADDGDEVDSAATQRATTARADRPRKRTGKRSRSAREEFIEPDTYRTVTVGQSRAPMFRRPSTGGKITHRLVKGSRVVVLKQSRSGKWMFVENTDGDQGWITSSVLAGDGFEYPKLLVRTGARGGYTYMAQDFTSDGNANYELANYRISSGSATASVTGDMVYRATPSVLVGADLGYTGSYASPGIAYEYTEMAYMVHELNVGAAAGYNFQSSTGAAAYARAGYHYNAFRNLDIQNNVNLARLPSEVLQGPTVGVRVDIPRLASNIGLRLSGDVLLPATRTQTQGLRDGNLESAFAAWGGALLTYHLSSSLNLEAGYRFVHASTSWTGPTQRPTGATNESARTDSMHQLGVGLGMAF